MMKNIVLAMSLLVFASSNGLAEDGIPCIPEGTTVSIPADLDPTTPGLPADVEIQGFEWYDQDDLSPNDGMGAGDPFDLQNKGGQLSGPNGDVVNGGWEGDCIDLWYTVTVRYKVWVVISIEPGGVGGSNGYWMWDEMTLEIDMGEVCPC